MKRPYEMSWSFGPGPAVMDARRTKETRQTYADATTRLWADAWGPPRPPGNGVLTAAFNAAAEHAALRQPGRTP